MLAAATLLLRGTAAAQEDVATVVNAVTGAVQALGGVAAAGEAVRAAHRSCSRRRRSSSPAAIAGQHDLAESPRAQSAQASIIGIALPVLALPDQSDQSINRPVTSDTTNRWRWKLEFEEMRRKWGELEIEKEKLKRDAEHLNTHMHAMMSKYMEAVERELQITTQKTRGEAE